MSSRTTARPTLGRYFLLFAALVLLTPFPTSAHPGRTDSRGGHTCRTRCSAWGLKTGQYHFHGGSARKSSARDRSNGKEASGSSSGSSFLSRARAKRSAIRVGEKVRALVTLVIDGDSFIGEVKDRRYIFQLECVDAPELEQPFGIVARDRLAHLLEEQSVELDIGRRSPVDQSWFVRVDLPKGGDPAVSLLQEGLLWSTCNRTEPDMEKARTQGVGLWSQTGPTAPWEFRSRPESNE